MLKHERRSGKTMAFGGAALAVLAYACGAHAQAQGQGTAAPAAAAGDALQEIVVTAEKRESTIQRTPIAVTAVSNDTLTREGVTQLANLERVVPDVKLQRQGAGMTVAIRGVYSTDNSPTSEAAVSVHVDGAYLAKTNGLQGFLYDVERVEVLKGPQGTLYGRNSNGGTINIITNKPVLGEYSASGEFEYGTHDTFRTAGTVNAPLNDTMAVRATFQTYSHSGYMLSGLDDADEQEGRISFKWKPDAKQQFTLVADYSHLGGKGDGANNVIAKQPGTNFYVPANPRDDRFYDTDTASGTAEVFHRDARNRGLTGQYDYNFDFATWTTEVAYRKFDSDPVNPNNLGQGASVTLAGVGTFPQAARNWVPQHFESWSLESRLASASSRPLQWVVGVYGFSDTDSGTMIGYGSLRATTPSIQIANPYEKATSGAVFGQLTYTPAGVDALHITLGARATSDHKNAQGIFTQFGLATPYAAGPSNFEKTWSAATWKAGLSYDLTDRNLLYGSVSTGFKSGGFAYGPGINPTQGPVYSPERITAYEIGSKNRFFENRLQVNLEGFYYKYKDYQSNLVLFAVGGPPLPILTVASAGSATYQGGTLDLQFAATSHDTFKFDTTIVKAQYGDYRVAAPAGYTGGFNKSNTYIPGVPNWAGTASYAHTFDLDSGRLNAEVYTSFRGHDNLATEDDPVYGRVIVRDHAWSLWNLSLRYEPNSGAWALTGYARNIGNDTHPLGAAYSTSTHLTSALFNDPRVVGFIFSAKMQK